jgi:hypothetical protein
VRYEPASSTPAATGCQTGTRALGTAIRAAYPELETLSGAYGCYNRRRIAGSRSWSLHAEGRALDSGFRAATLQLAWQLACELVAHRAVYGTMRVILDHHVWSTERPDAWHRLNPSTNQHTDHLHIEQFWRAALRPRSVAGELTAALRASRS